MASNFLALISVVISITTILVVTWQTYLTRRALQFQGYLGLESFAEGSSLREGIRALNSLPPYTDYQTFLQKESAETQHVIYDTVQFLSSVAHLVNEGYLDKYQAWSRYFFSFRVCYDKLYPWYIQGLRNMRYGGEEIAYATLEAMCVLVHEADTETAIKNKLLKRQRKRLRLSANTYISSIHLPLQARPHISQGLSEDGKGHPQSLDRRSKDVELSPPGTPGKTPRELM